MTPNEIAREALARYMARQREAWRSLCSPEDSDEIRSFMGTAEQLAEALYGLEDISEDWPWDEVPAQHRAGYVRRADALLDAPVTRPAHRTATHDDEGTGS